MASGAVQCWGWGTHGQLGNETSQDSPRPVTVTVSYTGTVAQIELGESVGCLRTLQGGVWCWGQDNVGQLGDGGGTDQATPQPMVGMSSGVVDISLSYATGCALMDNGSARCWGHNYNGELGNNSAAHWVVSPVVVAGLGSGVMAVTAGVGHVCAVTTWGRVQCWGEKANGELGTG